MDIIFKVHFTLFGYNEGCGHRCCVGVVILGCYFETLDQANVPKSQNLL